MIKCSKGNVEIKGNLILLEAETVMILRGIRNIPVEERLPGEGQKVLVWYEYCRYGEYNRMLKTYGIGWQFDGHWGGDVSGTKARCIAWQPLPEPYRRFKKELS